jgi:hypothetical protein
VIHTLRQLFLIACMLAILSNSSRDKYPREECLSPENKRRRSDSVPDPRQLTAVFDNLRQKRATNVGPTRIPPHPTSHPTSACIHSCQTTTTFNLHPNKPNSSLYPTKSQHDDRNPNTTTPPTRPNPLRPRLAPSLRTSLSSHLPNHLLTQMRTTGPSRRSRPRIRASKHHSFDDKRRRGG